MKKDKKKPFVPKSQETSVKREIKITERPRVSRKVRNSNDEKDKK